MPNVIIKEDRLKAIYRHHPWIFSKALEGVIGDPQPGETVVLQSPQGRLLGCGAYSPHSQIIVRVWSFDPLEEIGPLFFHRRIEQAIKTRQALLSQEDTEALRIVNAESDGLPGLIVDLYKDFLVCQFLSAGAEFWKGEIISQLKGLMPNRDIYERSDSSIREKEGLPPCKGLLLGEGPPDLVEINEQGCRFLVDIQNGHKTGFYLDQRENRALMLNYSEGREVLNCFSYTGGFCIYALKGGAKQVTNVECSKSALGLIPHHLRLNNQDQNKVINECDDVFQALRRYRDSRHNFDLIVLDPPRFVSSKGQLGQASRGYKDINVLAFKLLKPGGILFTFSCSELMPADLFQKIIADAALDAGREAQILKRLFQASDHPIALNFPEGAYLKGFICRVIT